MELSPDVVHLQNDGNRRNTSITFLIPLVSEQLRMISVKVSDSDL